MRGETNLDNLVQMIEERSGNKELVDQVKESIDNGDYNTALDKVEKFFKEYDKAEEEFEKSQANMRKIEADDELSLESENGRTSIYPEELRNNQLERDFIGALLKDPKLMSKYYILHDECAFENRILLEIYKGIVFTEGEAYTPYIAKEKYPFGKVNYAINVTKRELKDEYSKKEVDIEKVYIELKKLFVLRKNYLSMPIRSVQEGIVKITKYRLYNQMSEQEVKNAVNQVLVTDKFKQSILSHDVTEFLVKRDNNLTNGLSLPFKILSSVFKGVRRGETMSFAMPSNAGKSRFTINLAAYVAFVHKQRVLVISNEMSEEKMKLCLITTVLNNEAYQKMHGEKIKKTEGELLEFKFRPDDVNSCEVDEKGFVLKRENESQEDFAKRLMDISEEYRKTIKVTDWVNNQTDNAIHFVNITNHTNDELQKIIMNYYYKEEINYVFYDTLKTDTGNIGKGEEIKRTATILSNLAQNFSLYICSTIQLMESATLPINLDINDLAVSRTVKEVLDTLCLAKQINNDKLGEYEYSKNELDDVYCDLEKFNDPDVRYYACVVDKNRAGAKPKVLFRLNLAYNNWEELGYLRLKQEQK